MRFKSLSCGPFVYGHKTNEEMDMIEEETEENNLDDDA